MKKNISYFPAEPWNFEWTDEKINNFWGLVSRSPLENLSFSKFVAPQITEIMGNILPPNAKIIDFGAGSGHLCRELLARGFSVAAYEPSEKRCETISPDITNHPNFLGFKSKGIFDCIACFEVLEHIHPVAEDAVMNVITGLMDEKSILIGSTPNQEDMLQSLCVCPNCGALFHRWQHMRSFTPEILKKFLTSHNLEINKIFYPPWARLSMFFIAKKHV